MIFQCVFFDDINKRIASFVIAFFVVVPLVIAEDSLSSAHNTAELPVEIKQKLVEYQQCISHLMSSFEPAAVKRQQVIERCQTIKEVLVDTYPEEIQEYVNATLSDRIGRVLYALEQSERAVEEAVVDSHEIVNELEALSEKMSDESTD